MRQMLKRLTFDFTARHGYKVAKYPRVAFEPVPVFDLAVRLLMASKGQRLRFVQVGANDGRYGDSISRFALAYPFEGILVEPQADVFERLKHNYAAAPAGRMIFENAAIGPGQERLTMYRCRADVDVDREHASTVVSSDPHVVASQLKISESQLEAFTVPCLTLDALLAKHGWQAPDILFLDTEGFDQAVLSTIDLARTPPTIVQFEHGHLSPDKIDLAIAYLSANGYQVLYGGHQVDTVALHKSFWSHVEPTSN